METTRNVEKLLSVTASIFMGIAAICALIALAYLINDDYNKWNYITTMLYIAIPLFASSVIMFGLEVITKAAYLYIDNNKPKEPEVENGVSKL